ncbi:hypothetical protein PAXRUDRAFT_590446 [Paxillus rubicundulus Ve08.2h10]|uniref:Unplaced genomic scaffold scaffold_486, whole genome shotgun sequence n=1 Tax=Paxillus rubicundulus Ve08.2h10 TaxID=930991 RepID=A0A0D0E4G9_9AGAM|nr:hypothetical protein PAXRUDRAFT_590446 [Paxillus rubicundulus Ve08.2h10]
MCVRGNEAQGWRRAGCAASTSPIIWSSCKSDKVPTIKKPASRAASGRKHHADCQTLFATQVTDAQMHSLPIDEANHPPGPHTTSQHLIHLTACVQCPGMVDENGVVLVTKTQRITLP